jgi:paired amphipathic helix protein Sin3a
MAATARWSYYISTFAMRDLTEGLDLSKIDWPFLRRNMPPMLDTEDEYTRVYTPQWNEDGLVIRISSNNYHMLYDPLTQDWWVHNAAVQKRGLQGEAVLKDERKQKFEEKFVLNNAWMVGKSVEEVDQINQEYRRWVTEGPKAATEPPADVANQPAGTDEAMASA